MIELLGMSSPNVQKIQIMLEELAAPYKLTRIDVWRGDNFTPEFSAINPNHKVPVLIVPVPEHEVPMMSSGKLDAPALRAQLERRREH